MLADALLDKQAIAPMIDGAPMRCSEKIVMSMLAGICRVSRG